ncbi:MAG: flavodoxin-dependent (E)-4-hydroxy-3-methylbut-2-enyl-diphosphate synthase, partial [Candidatus Sumerlaeaceae bacterium]
QALGLRSYGVEVVACPTCGREDQGFDTTRIAREIEERTAHLTTPVKVSVMGCYVNGPGEAAEADLGVVASGKTARIYRQGRLILEQVPFADVTAKMIELIEHFAEEKRN